MFNEIVEIMKSEFVRRKERNKVYSLRSFSRDLDLDPSNLSKIFNGKKELSRKNAEQVAKKLGFPQYETLRLSDIKLQDSISDKKYQSHDLKIFQIISNWQHYAILELYKLNDVLANPTSIAKRLGLKPSEAQDCLNRLIEVNLLKFDKSKGGYVPADESSSSILNVKTSKAHRNQQRQILEGAIDALDKVPIEFRSQTSMTMAIDINKLGDAEKLIKNFRRKIGRFLSESNNLNEVYQLSISLYPVTQLKNKLENEN